MERVAIEFVALPAVVAHGLPAQVATVDVVSDSKYLFQAGFIQCRRQLEKTPKPLAKISVAGMRIHYVPFTISTTATKRWRTLAALAALSIGADEPISSVTVGVVAGDARWLLNRLGPLGWHVAGARGCLPREGSRREAQMRQVFAVVTALAINRLQGTRPPRA